MQTCMASKIVLGAVEERSAKAHHSRVSKPVRPNFKPLRRPTFIRAWRKYRDEMSLEKLAERLTNEVGYAISEGQLSRIERLDQPYTQDLLEALAVVLNCGPEDLLMRDPTKEDAAWSVWESLKPNERAKALRLLQASEDDTDQEESRRSGTGG
jgi:DNA-binding Xre family transcriptional regulator